jgi:deoxycytidylate deaminase
MSPEYYLKRAKLLSIKSDNTKHQMGCVIVKGNKILGEGYNCNKTHPASPHKWKRIHAEFMAVLKANGNVKGATVYIFRQRKDGVWSMARPCKDCWQMLYNLGVKNVVYSFQGEYLLEKL